MLRLRERAEATGAAAVSAAVGAATAKLRKRVQELQLEIRRNK